MAGFNHFGEIANQLHSQASQVARKTAFVIEGGAKVRATVDKGAMKNSIHVITSNFSDYDDAIRAARAANPDVKVFAELPKPASDQQAIVAVGVEYGEYVENGTVHMAAQPYLTPAAEAARPGFVAAMQQLKLG